jgi:hypothetical protein
MPLLLLLSANRQNLPPFIIAAGGTGHMGRDRAAALTAFAQLSRMPAVRRFARAQPHLRGFAFWNSHGEAGMKARSCEKTTACRLVVLKNISVPGRGRIILQSD